MFINAYYFRAHMYTLVPHQIREDMKWMADAGTDAVSIAVLEQDFFAARENIDIICEEARKEGMQVYAVPSRWGGLVAGSPKVPSLFSATHPDGWMLDRNGKPYFSDVCGIHSSIHDPATYEFYCSSVEKLLSNHPISGIIWDEVKILTKEDHSSFAQNKRPEGAGIEWDEDQGAQFFDRVGEYAKSVNNDVRLCMFLYSHKFGNAEKRYACIENLDDFGCDGRPWNVEDSGKTDGGPGKCLLGGPGEAFINEARSNGKGGLLLIENHNMQKRDNALMDRRMPEVLALNPEHLLYYYYPRNLEDPEENMTILRKHLKAVKS